MKGVKIVILGSCKHAPYELIQAPNPLNLDLYVKDHEAAYIEACKIYYPKIKQADIILVFAPNGEIGEHTLRDLSFAIKQKKPITIITNVKGGI